MSDSPLVSPAPKLCANCGAPGVRHYCPECGQRNVEMHAPLREMVSEAIEDAVGLDSRVAHTIRPFLVRPGFLTREFIEGRRARYTSPLKLYIATSAAYFLLSTSSFESKGTKVFTFELGSSSSSSEPGPEHPGRPNETASEQRAIEELRHKNHIGARLADQIERLNSTDPAVKAAAQSSFSSACFSALPKAVFAVLPVFALLLLAFHRKKDHFYIDHVVFALHAHAFFFTVALLLLALPHAWSGAVAPVLLLSTLAYIFRAQLVVYREGIVRSVAKLFCVLFLYALVVSLAIAAVALLELLLF